MDEEIKKMLESIQGEMKSLDEKLKAVDHTAEVKSLGESVKALQGDLKEAKKEVGDNAEFKGLADKLGERLDGIERTLNGLNVNQPGKRAEKKSFADVEELDEAMRNEGNVEVKSLDSDLKQQDIFLDGQPIGDYPLLAKAYFRPTKSDNPKYSYNTGAVVQIKGEEDIQEQNVRKKVELGVKTYEYKPTVDREDVMDVGALMLQDEFDTGKEGMQSRLNADCIAAIEAAGVASGDVADVYTEIVQTETATAETLTADEVRTFIRSLPKKYRRDAVIMGNSTMITYLTGLVDGDDVPLWQRSLVEGVPNKLCGCAFQEESDVSDDTLIIGNARWGLAIMEREKPTLSNVERSDGDYKPIYNSRYGKGVTDARAWKILKIKAAS